MAVFQGLIKACVDHVRVTDEIFQTKVDVHGQTQQNIVSWYRIHERTTFILYIPRFSRQKSMK